ncbi:hypothetical protein V6N13_025236 [Hibiscus sabdariffa]
MFDLAINITLDPKTLILPPNPLLLALVRRLFPYPGKEGSAILGFFGKEFPNPFALLFIRVNYVEVETILSWRLRIQVSRNQSCHFLRDFSLLCDIFRIQETKEFVFETRRFDQGDLQINLIVSS